MLCCYTLLTSITDFLQVSLRLRQYYESQLMKAKSTMESSVSKAVERALNSKMRVFSSETGEMSGGKNGVEDINRNLIKDET
ncbi:hypothetical protein ACFX2I_014061 [Malus domestica]